MPSRLPPGILNSHSPVDTSCMIDCKASASERAARETKERFSTEVDVMFCALVVVVVVLLLLVVMALGTSSFCPDETDVDADDAVANTFCSF